MRRRGLFFLRAPFTSTTGHRNAERANAIASITGSALQTFSSALIVPQTLAQSLISLYSLFRTDTHAHERVAHTLQALLALAQLIMSIYLIYGSNMECEEESNLCKSLKLMQLLYKGTLIVAWALSESSKDPYEPNIPPPVTVSNPPAPAPDPIQQPDVVIPIPDQIAEDIHPAPAQPAAQQAHAADVIINIDHAHHRRHHSPRNRPRAASVHSAASDSDDPDVDALRM